MAILFSLIILGLYCLTYVALFYLFPRFFNAPKPKFTSQSLFSLLIIILLSFLIYIISFSIPDIQLGNRFLHMFGGGFLAFLMCFLVVKDTEIKITKFQFFVFGLLVVTALGVGNEILEFALQNTTNYIFADSIADTWLDLVSNAIGALLASAVFVPRLTPAEETPVLEPAGSVRGKSNP